MLNSGNDGVFLVRRSTQYVYQVDDYGRRGKFLNTLDALIERKRQSRKHKLDERGILLTTDAERPRQLG